MIIEKYGVVVNTTFQEVSENETHRLTYSDNGVMIMQEKDGCLYERAIDLLPCDYGYTETESAIQIDNSSDEYIKKIELIDEKLIIHTADKIETKEGVHGLRYYDNTLQYFHNGYGEWFTISSNGKDVGGVLSVNEKTGDVVLGKEDIGLDKVDNTSDEDKPISKLTQLALDNKANISSIPKKISELTNDGGYVTSTTSDMSNYYTKTDSDSLYASRSEVTGNKTSKFVAHRGFNGVMQTLASDRTYSKTLNTRCPENSILAFQMAGEYGFWGCETDILMSSDGVFYCFHGDSDVPSLTGATGTITGRTSTEINALTITKGVLDYTSSYQPYRWNKIPLLNEFLEVCVQYGMHPVIELKGESFCTGVSDSVFSRLLSEIEAYVSSYSIISFNLYACQTTRRLRPHLDVYYLTTGATESNITTCVNNKLYWAPQYTALSKSLVTSAKQKGLKIDVWTVDNTGLRNFYNNTTGSRTHAELMRQLGVDLITTDCIYDYNERNFNSNSEAIKLVNIQRGQWMTTAPNFYSTSFLTTTSTTRAYLAGLLDVRGKTKLMVNYGGLQSTFKMILVQFSANGSVIKDDGWLWTSSSVSNYFYTLAVGACYAMPYFRKVDGTSFTDSDLENIQINMTLSLSGKDQRFYCSNLS